MSDQVRSKSQASSSIPGGTHVGLISSMGSSMNVQVSFLIEGFGASRDVTVEYPAFLSSFPISLLFHLRVEVVLT